MHHIFTVESLLFVHLIYIVFGRDLYWLVTKFCSSYVYKTSVLTSLRPPELKSYKTKKVHLQKNVEGQSHFI